MSMQNAAVVGLVWLGASALIGCGGDKDQGTDPDAVSCEGLATSVLGQVESTRWPAGLADALPRYDLLDGRWEASSSCGGLLTLKFVSVPREALEVVTSPYTAESSNCGCVADPEFGADEQYPMAAVSPDFEYFVEVFEDPALDGQTLRGEGVLFGTGAPISFRGCARDDVDPILQSQYDQVAAIVRIDNAGQLSGTLVLEPLEGEPEECTLSGFRLIEAL
jgi:hypothetical protein